MKKKLLIFMTVLVAVLLTVSLIACNDYTKPDDGDDDADTITRTQIVTNGTFYNATSTNKEDYVKTTVSGWTATKGSLATAANGVTMGAVDLSDNEAYNLNKDKFYAEGNVANPGVDPATPYDTDDNGNLTDKKQDTNALVVASRVTSGSVYYKNSSSFKLEPGKYYLLQYSVATFIDMTDVEEADKNKKGAWVHVTGGVEYVDSCINTDGKWETHYLYIETNKNETTSLDIRLWFGHGPEQISKKNNAYNSKGVAFFDNIICKEVTTATDKVYNDGKETELNHETFSAMAQTAASENGEIGYESAYYLVDTKLEQTSETTPTTTNAINFYYSFREGSYSSLNTKNFNTVKGKTGLTTSEQTSTTNAFIGIVDYSKLYNKDADEEGQKKNTYGEILTSSLSGKFTAPTFTEWRDNILNGSDHNASALDETKALMIYHSDLSGLGFTTKSTIKIETNKNYKISVLVYVWAPVDENGFVWPTADKPEEPAEYTESQEILVAYYDGTTAFPGAGSVPFADYIVALTDEEKETIKTAPASGTAVSDIELLAGSDDIKTAMIAAGYDEKVLESFRYLYVRENIDSFIAQNKLVEDDRNYIEYRYLSERNTFISNVWTDLKKLIDKKETYINDYTAYMAKYNVWKNNNEKPYAKVKLTGAGSDLEARTNSYNKGWEELTFYVQGNQLSARNLTLEMWFGEGSNTEYENLMFGGALFDNISIMEVDKADYENEDWNILSPISNVGELSFGGLINDEDTASYWEYELADPDKMASSDIDNIEMKAEAENNIGSLTVDGNEISLKQLVYSHKEATASILTSKAGANHENDIKILPNKAYRFAIRVKTEGIAEGSGVNIALMGGTNDEDKTEVSSISKFNSEEWKEVVFYVLGDTAETNYIGLRFSLGSGSRFDTSSYVKGTVYVAVANCTEIKYSEYNASAKSGDEVKSYSFSNTGTASESVTNGSFATIDYSSTDEKEFDENGVLTGVATTSSWTQGTAISNTFNSVELNVVSGENNVSTLSWEPVVGVDGEGNDTIPDAYEVYARFVEGKGTEAKTVERLYKRIEKEDANYYSEGKYNLSVDMTGIRSTAFRVRGVSENAVGAFSAYKTLGVTTEDKVLVTDADEVAGKKEIKAGTVTNDGTLFADSSYKSPYKTLLMISSNYGVGKKMVASGKTLNANTYYCVSVWVMTKDGAKAAVTVGNISKVLTADVAQNYIGYVGIDTQGKWVQYTFYIKTGASSSTFELELGLGNAYAIKTSKKSDSVKSSVATYKNEDLSQGTVYFDAVRVLEVEEKEYEDRLAKGEYEEDGTVRLHDFDYLYTNNKYAIRNLVYTVDSFDSFDENTVAEGSEGYNLGHTPNNYSWTKASDATGTTEDARLYGVYNYNMDIDKLNRLYTTDDEEAEESNLFASFMPEGFDIREFITMQGNNSLVMSNKVPYGQAYTTTSSSTINSKTYYKLSFNAKTMIAREVKDADGKVTYETDGVNAEFRFMQNSSTDKYQSVLINSYEEKEYSLYIYNPSSSNSSAKWAFYLGANADEDDKTGTKQLVIGMMVIDQVELTSITEEEFNAQKATFDALSDEEKINASSRVYSYDEDKTSDPEPDEDEKPADPDKTSVFDRGDVWLLVSSLVIAVIIIVVVVVVLVRRWKKKHPKETVGENVVKTEKEIKVVETPSQTKEDIVEDEEYSDKMPVTYNQRVVKKGKKKKK